MLSQNDMVLNHLKQGKSITNFDAVYEYGIFRLSARIYDLKHLGYPIKSRMEYNKETHKNYSRYSIDIA